VSSGRHNTPAAGRRWAIVGVLLAVLAVIVVLTPYSKRVNGSGSWHCTVSAKLVPSCGVLWGVATNPNTNPQLSKVESSVGRKFNIVYRFQDLDDQLPTPDERQLAAQGQTLHITIDAAIYAEPNRLVTWQEVAQGDFDSNLTAQAKGLAALHVPIFVTFEHEPDQLLRSPKGGPADYIAAWRHVHDLFEQAGATNLVWVWVVTGYAPNFTLAGQMWPGNGYVDWISWEAYNNAGCTAGSVDPTASRTFSASMTPFLTWLQQNGPAAGIDITKPMMISEAGSMVFSKQPDLTAQWYAKIPSVLRRYPQIRAITLWDRPGPSACRYQFDDVSSVLSAVSKAGLTGSILGP
jgi:hypothetical protein